MVQNKGGEITQEGRPWWEHPKSPRAGAEVHPGTSKAVEGGDGHSGGDGSRETVGEKAKNLKASGGMGGGPP